MTDTPPELLDFVKALARAAAARDVRASMDAARAAREAGERAPTITPPELLRRLYAQIENGKGMRLSADELDLLVEMGAVERVSEYVAEWTKEWVSLRRTAAAEERQAEIASRAHRRLPSRETAEEVMERARSRTGAPSKKR